MATITGTPFDDTLFGTASSGDIIVGLEGDDALYGLGGNDQLAGYDGNDILDGGIGIDRMFGGDGNDIYVKDNVRDEMTEDFDDASGGVDLVWSSVSHTLRYGFENLALMGVANISGAGNGKDNIIEGNSGRNVLKGGLGNDTLKGGNGADTLSGDSGDDVLEGGPGYDTASYATAEAGVTADLDGWSGVQNTVGAGLDRLVDIERLIGSRFDDTLSSIQRTDTTLNGANGNDRLYTDQGGNHTLNGGNGNDRLATHEGSNNTLNGGADNDFLDAIFSIATLNGGDGDDALIGWIGNYKLNGGAGNDRLLCDTSLFSSEGRSQFTMNGGAGADTFEYIEVNEKQPGSMQDVILDFSGASGDKIKLTRIDANWDVAYDQAFTYIGAAAFTAAGQLRYAGGLLQGSTDADAGAEFEIQLVGAPALVVQAGNPGSDILL